MPNNVILNNVEHKDLKVIRGCSAEYGHNVGRTLVFPTEFTQVQCEFPILFIKNPKDQQFQSVAILGLQADENLFLTQQGWQASYIPNIFTKGPFLIGFQEQIIDGVEQRKPVITVDMDDKRVSQEVGERVFLEFGGNSPYLERIQTALVNINDGIEISKQMFAAFTELDLLESVTLKLDIDADNSFQLEGYHTINAQNLAALSGEDLQHLHQAGFLQLAHAAMASLHNMQKIVNLKKAQVALDNQ